MFEQVDALRAEHARLERRLADPAVHADPEQARRLGRRYSELTEILDVHSGWRRLCDDRDTAVELARDDPTFGAEAEQLATQADALAQRLRTLLVPRDPADDRDVILEIKAGEGGEESALFAGDLLRMYTRFAEREGWLTELLDAEPTGLGGVRNAALAVKARSGGAPGRAPFARLKYEAGVHRVQRVPVTESQGRIHTSAAGVLVLPEAGDPGEVVIEPGDLRVDVFRSSGPGGQSVNTTDSAVRLTHLPTGLVVSCQNEKSQLQNREQALRILRARLLDLARREAEEQAAADRRSPVRPVDRSERIRTYNFPENRISDHRARYKAYNLDHVLSGDLAAVVDACATADAAARLSEVGPDG